jgi:S-adenosyl methyltransferase
VVYVDNDPIVLAHARALLTSSPQGATAYIDADLRATGTILERAADVLDLGQPVAARTHAEVSRFFAGLNLVEPGVVQVHRWRPGAGDQDSARNLAIYAGVGRKP